MCKHNVLFCEQYDNTIRWKEGERLDHVFEKRCHELTEKHGEKHAAVAVGDTRISYAELDRRANRLARFLRSKGVQAGARVGVMLKQTPDTYVTLLAILKLNAAYVPLDASFPRDRVSFIARDAGVRLLISTSENRALLSELDLDVTLLDEEAGLIAKCSSHRLTLDEKGQPSEQLCYIVYTSGSTGNPKGVAVDHPSICNFVKVAAEVYGYTEADRVYQGMTIAFDFSVEEIWVPLLAGATLVPGISNVALAGCDLADFLSANHVTAMCCVPTLLATIDRDLPDLRLLLLSGEACPQDLVSRWYKPGRTLLNVYGPTEATVTATWTELHPEKRVTIGVPLPTYSVVILDEHEDRLAPAGGLGEICIAGIGLAQGYVNREDLTKKAFIPDFLNIENNPSKRIYRTGDLGRILEKGEIEYHGRIDTQVKIRGYRIELTEIESVLMEVPNIAQAIVNKWAREGSPPELVAYCTLKNSDAGLPTEKIASLLKSRLPSYMIPAYIEVLAEIPMLPSNKADRKKLPPPLGPRFLAGGDGDYVAPDDDLEQTIADAMARVLEIERVSVEDHFFNALGAHSLLMARASADIRSRIPGASVSMRDMYLNPTVRLLAGHIRSQIEAPSAEEAIVHCHLPSAYSYYLCGAFQLGFYAAFGWLGLEVIVRAFDFMLASNSLGNMYVRAVALNAMLFFGYSALPLIAKWVFIGKWKADRFPIWGMKYYRFWVVKTLMQVNPILLFRYTPIFNFYLRLLGAKVGRNAVILSQGFPLCTDLIDIGEGAVLRSYSIATGYKAEAGYIVTGEVTIGRNAIVGEHSLVDIGTRMGEASRLAHASLLPAGREIPAGKTFHGSPARECATVLPEPAHRPVSLLRKALYSILYLGAMLCWVFPILPIVFFLFFPELFGRSLITVASRLPEMSPLIVLVIFAASGALMLGFILVNLLRVYAVPRVLSRFLVEDREYPLYSLNYLVFRLMTAASNVPYFNTLFGDSSYIVRYLRLVGVDLSKIIQTGSNFGTHQQFDSPFLCKVGTGTMVSSTLMMINGQYSSTSFRLTRSSIGDNNFLGNIILVPPGSKAGENCLLATKVALPIDGETRTNIGLLGSPAFEIPRNVGTDQGFAAELTIEEKRQLLFRKNVANITSMLTVLATQWIYGLVALTAMYWTLKQFPVYGIGALAAAIIALLAFSIFYFAFMEWWSLGFRRLRANRCTILHRDYWQIEHHWKMSETILMFLFKGTPFKNLISRLVGTKTGKYVFDDGYVATERTLVEIGDYCTLNEFSIVQSHSMEDGIFKSDMVRLGAGTTVGMNALVHYGVTTGEQVIIDSDSFVMKGETPGEKTMWRGNPAMQVTA